MPTLTDSQLHTFDGWTFRLRPASRFPARVCLLLHGWKGDETSMWVFARHLPDCYTVLAPRAPYVEPTGGYTWRKVPPGKWGLPALDDLRPAADALVKFLDDWSASTGLDGRLFDVAGFSQGAALTYTLALLHPQRVGRFAALSGFLPAGAEVRLAALSGKRVFVAHGRQDELIPVEQARQAAALLEAAGARVTLCESDEGHRVGKECFKKMEAFWNGESSLPLEQEKK